ncbi:hypothetical protein EDD86DRAFT_188816 [Gorgonomyces haynaldii]|nr:hypothetical protein EDD86DRAFT_188816 [Gorgonomyces haynaldii]
MLSAKQQDTILEQLSPPVKYYYRPRYSYIIVGKPGCGKTTLAQKLANYTKAKLIEPMAAISGALSNPLHPQHASMVAQLTSGQTLKEENTINLMKELSSIDDADFKGVVVDGLPVEHLESLMSIMEQTVQRPGHVVVLVQMNISNENLLKRRAARWVDPVTNETYSGQQVLYSRLRRSEGYIDGDVDQVAVLEQDELYGIKAPQEKQEEEQEEEVPVDVEKRPVTLRNQISWTILSEQVLSRLIKFPMDDPQFFGPQIKQYKKLQEPLKEFRAKNFPVLNIIDLDATLHPDMLFDHLKKLLLIRSMSIYNPVIVPRKLPAIDGGFSNVVLQDALKHYQSIQLAEGDPPRELSIYQQLCPVTFATTGVLFDCDFNFCCLYKAKLYFFATEGHQDKFILHPEKYLSKPLEIKKLRLFVLGGPLTGKSLQSQLLAKKYGLKLVSVDQLLLDASNGQPTKPLIEQALYNLKMGSPIPPETYVQMVQDEIVAFQEEGFNGWILDAFPKTNAQAQLLIDKQIIPTHIVSLTNAISDEGVRNRESPIPAPISLGTKDKHMVQLSDFQSKYLAHKDEMSGIQSKFEEQKSHLVSVDADRAILPIITSIVYGIDNFVPRGIPMSLDETTEVEWGACKDYCPFNLFEKRQLTRGNRAFAIRFMGKTSICASEEARLAVLAEPTRFLTKAVAPPPRLVFVGTRGSGRKTFAQKLGERWDIPFVDFLVLAKQQLELEGDSWDPAQPLPSKIVSNVFQNLYTMPPFADKGFILHGFPLTKSDVETVLKNGTMPDAFVVFRCEAPQAVKRIFKKEYNIYLEKMAAVVEKTEENKEQSPEEFKDELLASLDRDIIAVTDLMSQIEAYGLNNTVEINSGHCVRPVWDSLQRKLKPFLENRKDLFSRAVPLTEQQAEVLLESGTKTFSNLGKYCPVNYKENEQLTMSMFGSLPVQFEDHIFYCRDQEALNEFVTSPLRYMVEREPQPLLFPSFCVLGDSKAGKTSLAKSLAEQMDAMYLTATIAIQCIIDGQEMTALADQVLKTLERGETITDEHLAEAIVLMTSRLTNAGKGWVLDGFPLTKHQAQLLEQKQFQPHCIVEMQLDQQTMIERAFVDYREQLRTSQPRMNHKDIVLLRQEHYKKEIDAIRDIYSTKYGNWAQLDGTHSKWALKTECFELSKQAVLRRQNYYDCKRSVSFEDLQILEKAEDPYAFAAEYQNRYYCMVSEQLLVKFLENPAKYVAGSLPPNLPRRLSSDEVKQMFPKQFELKGYCPVTFLNGDRKFESIVPGDPEFVLEYQGNIYCFQNLMALNTFKLTPWKFVDLVLPAKLPPPSVNINVNQLPMIGYLEQTVAQSLTKALSEVGAFKPKHPYKSVNRSASEFVGLYLKANNKRSKEWVRDSYNKKLSSFKNNCVLLQELTQEVKTMADYIPKEERPLGFDAKIDLFLSLK